MNLPLSRQKSLHLYLIGKVCHQVKEIMRSRFLFQKRECSLQALISLLRGTPLVLSHLQCILSIRHMELEMWKFWPIRCLC